MSKTTPQKRKRSARISAAREEPPAEIPSSPGFYVAVPEVSKSVLHVRSTRPVSLPAAKTELSALQLRKQKQQQTEKHEVAESPLIVNKPHEPMSPIASPKSPQLSPSPTSNDSLRVRPYAERSERTSPLAKEPKVPKTKANDRYFAAPVENRRSSKRRKTNESIEEVDAVLHVRQQASTSESEGSSAPAVSNKLPQDSGEDVQAVEEVVAELDNDMPQLIQETEESSQAPAPDAPPIVSDPNPDQSFDQSMDDVQAETLEAEVSPQPPKATFTAEVGRNVLRIPTGEGTQDVSLLIGLEATESITLAGSCTVRVLSGSINIAGAVLAPSSDPLEVMAPSTHALPVISVHPNGKQINLTSDPVNVDLANTSISSAAAVVLLQPLKTGLHDLSPLARMSGMLGRSGQIFPAATEDEARNGTGFQLVSDEQLLDYGPRGMKRLAIDAEKEAVLCALADEKSERLVCLVGGQKRTGKSSLAKMAVNRLLSTHRRVAWLDCDLGQSEFTPSGMVSLHLLDQPVIGPAFSHPRTPSRAHYIGSTTPAIDPQQYTAAIHDLYQYYEQHVMRPEEEMEDDGRRSDLVPLIVNTYGWSKGLGSDLLQQISYIVRPSIVLQLGDVPVSYPDSEDGNGPRLHQLEPISDALSTSKITAADARVLMLLSYMYSDPLTKTWTFDKPLVSQTPLALDWTSPALQSVHILPEEVAYEHALYALNGSLVAVLVATAEAQSRLPGFPYDPNAPIPSPAETTCLGFALIRSVDPSTNSLHILTPIPIHQLKKPVILVKAEIELPVVAMLDQQQISSGREADGVCGVEWESVPYLTLDIGEGAGAAKRRARRNLQRRSLA